MTHIPNYMPAPQPIPGRAGLITFGIISIVLGALAGCASLTMPLAMLAARMAPQQQATGMTISGMILAMTFYVAAATALIWTGIGSCRCQRWVRPVILCVAWPGLIFGILAMVFMAPMLATMPIPTQPGAPPMPPQFRVVMAIISISVLVVFYILLPGAYIAFYQRRGTAEALAQCDLQPRWTDRCPIPVLGLSIWSGFTGVAALSVLQFRCLPFFGTYITGAPALVGIVCVSAALIFAAWSCYHLRTSGWWTVLLVMVLWLTSTGVTFALTGVMEFYRHADLPEQQLQVLEQSFAHGPMLPIMIGIYGALCLGYLLYARRYFLCPPEPAPARERL